MRKLLFLLCISTTFCNCLIAQKTASAEKTAPKLLTTTAFNVVINKALSSVASGQENGTALTNHAAFDPSKGSFLLNGYVPIFYKGDTARNLSFLNFKISAGLINDNATVLFQNTKLNSNVSIDLKYSFSTKWKGISYLRSERVKLESQLKFIELRRTADAEKINIQYSTTHIDNRIKSVALNIDVAQEERKKNLNTLNEVQAKAENFAAVARNVDSLKVYADSISGLLTKLDKINNIIYELITNKDSLTQVLTNRADLLKQVLKEHKTAYESKLIQAQMNAKLTSLHFGWFSAGMVLNRKKYFTFNDMLAFGDQIGKGSLDAFNLTAEYNYYHQWFNRNRILYFNAGLLKRKSNNLDDLSPTTIEQERAIVSGDTKRVITKKYEAYTDAIEEFRSVLVYTNLYYFIGKKGALGIHLFPEMDFRTTKKKILSNGLGVIVAVKDEKKDKNILNIETYINFTDMTNELNSSDKFYQRIDIGLRVGLPIKLIL